jgi:hypothetical protein
MLFNRIKRLFPILLTAGVLMGSGGPANAAIVDLDSLEIGGPASWVAYGRLEWGDGGIVNPWLVMTGSIRMNPLGGCGFAVASYYDVNNVLISRTTGPRVCRDPYTPGTTFVYFRNELFRNDNQNVRRAQLCLFFEYPVIGAQKVECATRRRNA